MVSQDDIHIPKFPAPCKGYPTIVMVCWTASIIIYNSQFALNKSKFILGGGELI